MRMRVVTLALLLATPLRAQTGGGGGGGGGAGSRVLVGAFESPEQASLTEARLKRAGVQATLVTRMGTTP